MAMTPNERKAALMLRDVTISEIARGLGVTVGHVSHVVAGNRRSPNVEQAIADAIGQPLADVFEVAAEVAP